MTKYILFLLSLFLMILSCEKEEEPFISINESKINLANTKSTKVIQFTASRNWTARSSEEWCSISEPRGSTSAKSLTIVAKANDRYEPRSCTISITIKGMIKTVEVYQSQKDAISLSSTTEQLSNESQTLEIELETNVEDYEIIIADNAKGWVSNATTRALRTEKITFKIEENYSHKARSADVYIKNIETTLQDKLTIIQEGTPVATPIVSPAGGFYTDAQTINMTTATDGAEIRYTLDGSEPTETSELYTGEFVIEESITIRAKALKTDYAESSLAWEKYIFGSEGDIIVGSSETVQHIDVPQDFIFQLNNLDQKDVYFVFSNTNETRRTPLPQLESNVTTTTMHKVMQSRASSQTLSFVVSGKPSITRFNNNVRIKPEKSVSKTEHQRSLTTRSANLAIGWSEDLYDDEGEKVKSTVRKVISAHGKTLYVWVADNCWEQGSKKKTKVTQQMVDEFAPKFLSPGNDNDIYEWVTNAAGDPWGDTGASDLIADTDDIHIWLTDIDNDNNTGTGSVTLGYFYARDNFTRSTYSDSNEKLIFAIDAVLFAKKTDGAWDLSHYWPMELISTLAHEFTHMIYFYQHNILTNQIGNTAINEMCAQCVEDLVATKILADGPRGVPYATPSAGYTRNSYGRLPLYNSYNDYSLLEWSTEDDEELVNYSKTYALGAYLMRNYGGAKFIRELIQNNYDGVSSIVEAVNANGGDGLDYGQILQQFGAANLLSDQTMTTKGYKFNTDDWSQSNVNGVTYNLGAINLYNYSPTPYMYDELPSTGQNPNSNLYYRAGSKLSGNKEWYFTGMDSDTRLTVVIK